MNITSADTICLQHSELLTVQCSRANGGSGQKNLTFASPEKKPPGGYSKRPGGVLGLSGGRVANADS